MGPAHFVLIGSIFCRVNEVVNYLHTVCLVLRGCV